MFQKFCRRLVVPKKTTFDMPQYIPTIHSILKNMMKVPSSLHGVKIQPYQVISLNEVGFDPVRIC